MSNKKNIQQKLTTAKKLTLSDLLAKKLQKDSDSITFKEIEIKSLAGALVFTRPNNDAIIDTLDKLSGDSGTREVMNAYRFLIYHACQLLHNQELQDAYEVKDPLDIVDRLFEISEVLYVGNELLGMAGFTDIEQKIKN